MRQRSLLPDLLKYKQVTTQAPSVMDQVISSATSSPHGGLCPWKLWSKISDFSLTLFQACIVTARRKAISYNTKDMQLKKVISYNTKDMQLKKVISYNNKDKQLKKAARGKRQETCSN